MLQTVGGTCIASITGGLFLEVQDTAQGKASSAQKMDSPPSLAEKFIWERLALLLNLLSK